MDDMDDMDQAQMTPAQQKLFQIRMKVNAGRKANKKEVAEEHERVTHQADAKQKKEERVKRREEKKRKASDERAHLNDTAEKAQDRAQKDAKKAKKQAAFGWDVFNQDSLYKGYKKRLANLPTTAASSKEESTAVVSSSSDQALEDELSYGKTGDITQEGLERMSSEVEARIQDRQKFSRRRRHVQGEDVDYINGQNRLFNRKAKQAYDKYTVEIRQNLERGTAL